jgi:hypothetical protein
MADTDLDLRRMADAAENLCGRRDRLKQDDNALLEWLGRKHLELGSALLSRALKEDTANLSKVISGKRRLTKSLRIRILELQQKGNSKLSRSGGYPGGR